MKIVRYEFKKELLSFDERSNLLSTAYVIASGGTGKYNPVLSRLGFRLATLISYYNFYNEKDKKVDVLKKLNTDKLYELVYMFDYVELQEGKTKKQLKEIRKTYKDMINHNNMMNLIELSQVSKYDEVLERIITFFDSYKNTFDGVDMDKFMKDFSMLSNKLKDVNQEEVVKEIIKTMNVKDEIN